MYPVSPCVARTQHYWQSLSTLLKISSAFNSQCAFKFDSLFTRSYWEKSHLIPWFKSDSGLNFKRSVSCPFLTIPLNFQSDCHSFPSYSLIPTSDWSFSYQNYTMATTHSTQSEASQPGSIDNSGSPTIPSTQKGKGGPLAQIVTKRRVVQTICQSPSILSHCFLCVFRISLIAVWNQKSKPDYVPQGMDVDRDSDIKITGEIKPSHKPEARTGRVRELLKYYEELNEIPDKVSALYCLSTLL